MPDINGIPYVESGDLVAGYPAVSQSLAQEVSDQLASKLDLAGGKILQVVSTAKSDTAALSTSAQTFSSDVMTATITPSATSSKIFITGFLMMSSSDTVLRNHVRLLRDATPIGVADAASNRAQATSVTWGDLADVVHSVSAPFGYLDSPNSTSALTYSVQMYNSSGITRTLYVNRSSGDTDSAATMRGISVITLMEVSG